MRKDGRERCPRCGKLRVMWGHGEERRCGRCVSKELFQRLVFGEPGVSTQKPR